MLPRPAAYLLPAADGHGCSSVCHGQPGAPEENVLIGTQGGVILVYRDMELIWSAGLVRV